MSRKDKKLCEVCCRLRNDVPVDRYHVCEACRRGGSGMPRRLSVVTLSRGKHYFIDKRLKELRNVENPLDKIDL